ncbi:MAG: mechanosensitive ion channel family protein [Muribaculaceae bacterium]|nr:mechanosensitive ion channel family protein [Muribaculaceae bacterium]
MIAAIPTHQVAQWILNTITGFLDSLGLKHDPRIEEIIYIIVIVAVAILIGWLIRLGILFAAKKIVGLRKSEFGKLLLQQHTLTKCSHIIPPLVFLALVPFAFESGSRTLHYITKIVGVYTVIMFGIGLSAIITFIWSNYDRKANKENHPLKGVANIIKGVVWAILIIIAASILIGKSPMALLAGLGAFAAALMLIFKDSILGFVAGIQMSSNDMLRVGDWIVVPSTIANGVVVDVSLSVVKVQNWDNTIVMVPPYTLVSTSFQNWRGMSESGVRQIDRSVIIDNTSIVEASEELLNAVGATYPEMNTYIANRRKALADGQGNVFNGGVAPVNGTIDTNLGLFRAYMCQYLLAHPKISNDNNIIVRLMNPDNYGTPLDIYCFTNTTEWLAYEAIRSQIFEHIAATAPKFGLRIFNSTFHGNIEIAQAEGPRQVGEAAPATPSAK